MTGPRYGAVEVLIHTQALIGESPVWEGDAGVLLWVDILRGEIHATVASSGVDAVLRMGTAVGAVALRRRGGLVAAAGDGFCFVADDDARALLRGVRDDAVDAPRSEESADVGVCQRPRWLWRAGQGGALHGKTIDGGAKREPFSSEVVEPRCVSRDAPCGDAEQGPTGLALRMNDAKCDVAGRLWGGTMTVERRPGACALYRLDPEGTVSRALGGVTLSNGLGWSPNGRTMYYIDTPLRRVDAFDFDVDTAAITRRRHLVQMEAGVGNPDGMTVDAEGCLWVAMAHGSAIRRYTPAGRLDKVVTLPVRKVTSCSFGGPGLDQLFVTTACVGLSEQELVAEPLAGAVLCCEVGARGLPADRFAG